MPAHLYDTSAHALPRVRSRAQERLRAPSRSWPSSAGCKTASKKKFSFSRRFPHARCALAQNAPREFALFPVASMLGATNKNFSWLYAQAQTNATLGTSYTYGDGNIPSWALLGEFGNGGATSTGRTEYIWLPTDGGSAIPVGMFRSNRFYAVHSDHLGTPRLMTDDTAKPVWQWAYSAFGDNKPTGVLKVTTNPNTAFTSAPLLAATNPAVVFNLRHDGQYFDSETGHFQNFHRNYMPGGGRYTQPDPIGLGGGWNQFIYVEGNPVSSTDPLGLQSVRPQLRLPTPIQLQLPGMPAPSPGPQPVPNWYRPPSSSSSSYTNSMETAGARGDVYGALTGGGIAGHHPSVPNAIETLIDPSRTDPFVPGPRTGSCTVITVPAPSGMCPAQPTTRLVCGPVIGPR
jgi:RHS repeat-associated protein